MLAHTGFCRWGGKSARVCISSCAAEYVAVPAELRGFLLSYASLHTYAAVHTACNSSHSSSLGKYASPNSASLYIYM